MRLRLLCVLSLVLALATAAPLAAQQQDIGPTTPFFRDYSPAPEYDAATARFKGEARIGPESSLEDYTAEQPFPMEEIDCLGDPRAGEKIDWNFDYQ